MIFKPTSLDGVLEIESNKIGDHRGAFVKTFHADTFRQNNLESDFKESYYSVSKKGVLRGMHFQIPPHDHAKLVYVTEGVILDVVVDIRKPSPTFGRNFSINLSSKNAKSIYMDKGFAHGFLALSDSATVVYLTSSVHSPESDTGIKWDSFGFSWPEGPKKVSERDSKLITISEYYQND